MSGDAGYFKDLFPKTQIPSILSALLQAGSTIKKKTENDHEDWITRRIYAKVITAYPFRDGPLDIRPQPEILSDAPDADTPGGKIDLLVSCGRGYHVYFAIEAKRLRFYNPGGKIRAGNAPYVNDGMMRFVSGQYAPFMETGAMMGYVFDGETGKARSGVANYIRKKEKELRLRKPKGLMKSEILADRRVDETLHDLGERQFTIYHLFVAV